MNLKLKGQDNGRFINIHTSLMTNKITPFVDQNYWLKVLNAISKDIFFYVNL